MTKKTTSKPIGHFERSEDGTNWSPISLAEMKGKLAGRYKDINMVIKVMRNEPMTSVPTGYAFYRFVKTP